MGAQSRNCSNFARNIIIFGVDNSSSFHVDKCKNNFLILGEEPTYEYHKLSYHIILIILLKKIQNFA